MSANFALFLLTDSEELRVTARPLASESFLRYIIILIMTQIVFKNHANKRKAILNMTKVTSGLVSMLTHFCQQRQKEMRFNTWMRYHNLGWSVFSVYPTLKKEHVCFYGDPSTVKASRD